MAKGTSTKGRRRIKPAVVVLGTTLVVLGLLYAAALAYVQPAAPGREITLDAFEERIPNGDVETARFLDQDSRITGTILLVPDEPLVRYWVSYPRSDAATNDLLKGLLASDTQVEIDPQSTKGLVRFLAQFLMPLVILANLFALLFYLVRGNSGGTEEFLDFGSVGDKMLGEGGRGRTTFLDVAGSDEAVIELAEVRDYLAEPAAFKRMGALPPKGVLLIGPPGCGKTLLARAVAGEANANFFSISGSEFVESLVGVGAARVRDLFRQARASAPSIIFIDELDAVGRQRGAGIGGGHDEREQTLNELLVQMDGFSPTEGVAVLAATNRADILDPALLRPGRFDRHITIEKPDRDGRLDILYLHAKGRRLADAERQLPIIARQTPGFTGADLASVLNEAALLAVRERSQAVSSAHLEEAVERVVGGPRRKAVIIPEADKRRIAVHEGGHAIVAAAVGQAMALDKLSIIARGRGVGHVALASEDSMLPTREDLESRITIAMAGVAAEELVFGQISTGSESDLERATNAARDMAGRFGMSDRLGRVRILREDREVFLGRDYLLTKDVSQPTLEHLDAEVRRILDEQEARARAILIANKDTLRALASALASAETLQGDRLRSHLETVQTVRQQTAPGRAPAGANNSSARDGAGE